MLDVSGFLDEVASEVKIIRHLASKITPADLEYRPTPEQRSMVELLAYLSNCSSHVVRGLVTDDWSHGEAVKADRASLTLEAFDDRMGQQETDIRSLLEPLDSAALAKPVNLPWADGVPLGASFMWPYRMLVAYRMQLFLYVKQAGHPELGTWQCWAGEDPPPKESEAE